MLDANQKHPKTELKPKGCGNGGRKVICHESEKPCKIDVYFTLCFLASEATVSFDVSLATAVAGLVASVAAAAIPADLSLDKQMLQEVIQKKL